MTSPFHRIILITLLWAVFIVQQGLTQPGFAIVLLGAMVSGLVYVGLWVFYVMSDDKPASPRVKV